jgi:hypothetical protein
MDDAQTSKRRSQIAALPRVKFVCGRDWAYGPEGYKIGVMWRRNFDAGEGEMVYSKRWLLCLRWRFSWFVERQ